MSNVDTDVAPAITNPRDADSGVTPTSQRQQSPPQSQPLNAAASVKIAKDPT